MLGRSDDPFAARPDGSPALRVALGKISGFSLLALTTAVVIVCTIPVPHAGIGLRLAHLAFDAAETIGIGAFLGLLLGGFRRFAALPSWAAGLVYAAVITPVLYTMVGGDLLRQATVAFE